MKSLQEALEDFAECLEQVGKSVSNLAKNIEFEDPEDLGDLAFILDTYKPLVNSAFMLIFNQIAEKGSSLYSQKKGE